LCSWAAMTPRHRESDTKVHRGAIPKQGCRLLRWAAVKAVSKNHGSGDIKDAYRRIAERRGRNIARVAAARRLLTPGVLRAARRADPLPSRARPRVSQLGRSQQTGSKNRHDPKAGRHM
jgi:hypothetical protein